MRARPVLAAVVLIACLTCSCRVASIGGRCGIPDFAINGQWVLLCRSHHWVKWKTVGEVEALLAPPSDGVRVTHRLVVNGSRQLPTSVYRPATDGPWPLVVFAHGYNSSPGRYDRLLRSIAADGFEVAAPASPGQDPDLGPLDRNQLNQQPGDLSATISAVVGDGSVVGNRIAVIGHSDGGSAVAAMAFMSARRDPRVAAYVVLSGALSGLSGAYDAANDGPLLAVVGNADEYGNLGATARVFERASAPRALDVIGGGRHIDPYVDATPQADAVRRVIGDFLIATLDGRGWDQLRADGSRDGLTLLPDLPNAPPTTTTTTTTTSTTTTTNTTTTTTTLP